MKIVKSHKIRLVPNNVQETYFKKACGVSRVAYNWGLARWTALHDNGEKTSAMGIKKEFNQVKKELFPWISEIHKDANQQPFANLATAFSRFFKKQNEYPVFKKKGIHDSFYISNDKLTIDDKAIKIPKLGWVKLREELRFNGKINSAVVSKIADKWFVSISVTLDEMSPTCDNQDVVGVDLGVKTLATLSTGEVFDNIKALRNNEERLKRLQRCLSRKLKGSNNRRKARMHVAIQHYKISCLRKDVLHKITTYLAKNYGVIVLEDLNVSGMLKNHKLAKAITDISFYEFRRQLEYKAKLYGSHVVFANRFFPSSKKCSSCGNVKKELKLSERVYTCDVCGLKIDRDLNAARNLEQIGRVSPESTPVEMEALATCSLRSETTVCEAGINLHK